MSGEATNVGKKFPHESRKAHSPFPHEWLSRRGEKKFHHMRRSRAWWNFFLPQLLSHEWGKGECALSDEWGNLPIPISSHYGIFIPIWREKTSPEIISITTLVVLETEK